MSDESKRPIASFGIGPYSVGLWENSINIDDGSQRVMKSISLRKGYYDKRENRMEHQSLSINPAELGSVIALLEQMHGVAIENRSREPF